MSRTRHRPSATKPRLPSTKPRPLPRVPLLFHSEVVGSNVHLLNEGQGVEWRPQVDLGTCGLNRPLKRNQKVRMEVWGTGYLSLIFRTRKLEPEVTRGVQPMSPSQQRDVVDWVTLKLSKSKIIIDVNRVARERVQVFTRSISADGEERSVKKQECTLHHNLDPWLAFSVLFGNLCMRLLDETGSKSSKSFSFDTNHGPNIRWNSHKEVTSVHSYPCTAAVTVRPLAKGETVELHVQPLKTKSQSEVKVYLTHSDPQALKLQHPPVYFSEQARVNRQLCEVYSVRRFHGTLSFRVDLPTKSLKVTERTNDKQSATELTEHSRRLSLLGLDPDRAMYMCVEILRTSVFISQSDLGEYLVPSSNYDRLQERQPRVESAAEYLTLDEANDYMTPIGDILPPDYPAPRPPPRPSTSNLLSCSYPNVCSPAHDTFSPAPDVFSPAPGFFSPAPEVFSPAPGFFSPAPQVFNHAHHFSSSIPNVCSLRPRICGHSSDPVDSCPSSKGSSQSSARSSHTSGGTSPWSLDGEPVSWFSTGPRNFPTQPVTPVSPGGLSLSTSSAPLIKNKPFKEDAGSYMSMDGYTLPSKHTEVSQPVTRVQAFQAGFADSLGPDPNYLTPFFSRRTESDVWSPVSPPYKNVRQSSDSGFTSASVESQAEKNSPSLTPAPTGEQTGQNTQTEQRSIMTVEPSPVLKLPASELSSAKAESSVSSAQCKSPARQSSSCSAGSSFLSERTLEAVPIPIVTLPPRSSQLTFSSSGDSLAQEEASLTPQNPLTCLPNHSSSSSLAITREGSDISESSGNISYVSHTSLERTRDESCLQAESQSSGIVFANAVDPNESGDESSENWWIQFEMLTIKEGGV